MTDSTARRRHATTRPDPWDRDLSVILGCAENIGPWLAIWEARTEPDPSARTCASNAIDSIDAMTYALQRIRARLVSETRQADGQAAERVDALLARLRQERGEEVPGE